MFTTFATKYCAILCLIIMLGSAELIASDNSDSGYTLSGEFSVGFASTANSGFLIMDKYRLSSGLRIMWQPDHRLMIGLQASYIALPGEQKENVNTEFGKTDFKAGLRTAPILLVFGMKIWELNIYGGMGVGRVTSSIEAFGEIASGYEWNNAIYTGVGYRCDFSRYFGLGIENRTYYFSKHELLVNGTFLNFYSGFLRW